jgi:hypothetical protein
MFSVRPSALLVCDGFEPGLRLYRGRLRSCLTLRRMHVLQPRVCQTIRVLIACSLLLLLAAAVADRYHDRRKRPDHRAGLGMRAHSLD